MKHPQTWLRQEIRQDAWRSELWDSRIQKIQIPDLSPFNCVHLEHLHSHFLFSHMEDEKDGSYIVGLLREWNKKNEGLAQRLALSKYSRIFTIREYSQ